MVLGYIDLSKRRVSAEEVVKCEEKFAKAKAVSLMFLQYINLFLQLLVDYDYLHHLIFIFTEAVSSERNANVGFLLNLAP